MADDKVKVNVSMELTVPQALAMKAFFEHWNLLSTMGSSRYVGFFVDGDGDFKPNCEVELPKEISDLMTDELKNMAMVYNGDNAGDKSAPSNTSLRLFDYDTIAWKLMTSK